MVQVLEVKITFRKERGEKVPSFLYMKILESAPERYDRGIRMLSRGRIDEVYEIIARRAAGEGKSVLDIGCGTGNVSLACAAKGASVRGIDINPGMLEIAEKKAKDAGLDKRVEFIEIGVAEIRSYIKDRSVDACVSCLAFSEMSEDEQSYAISSAYSVLKDGGIMIIADESVPESSVKRFLNALVQVPVRLLAYVLTQSTTHPVRNIRSKLERSNFVDVETKRMWRDSFMIVIARREKAE